MSRLDPEELLIMFNNIDECGPALTQLIKTLLFYCEMKEPEGDTNCRPSSYFVDKIKIEELTRWKHEATEMLGKWDAVDEFVRNHSSLTIGDSVVDKALQFLKERGTLKEENSRLCQQLSAITHARLVPHVLTPAEEDKALQQMTIDRDNWKARHDSIKRQADEAIDQRDLLIKSLNKKLDSVRQACAILRDVR